MKESCQSIQAKSMAMIADIKLRPQQIDDYVFTRNCEEFMGECDQVLLDLCLDDNQEIKFREFYKHIF